MSRRSPACFFFFVTSPCGGTPRPAGALLFAFSGFQLLHLNHLNMVAVTAHIPWLLYSADVLMTAPEPRRRAVAFAGIGLTLGSALLLGFPQGVWVNGVALGWLARLPGGESITTVTGCAGVRGRGRRSAHRRGPAGANAGCAALLFPCGDHARLPGDILAAPVAISCSCSRRTPSPRGLYAPSSDEWFIHEFGVYNGAICTLSLFWIAARWSAIAHRRLAAWLFGLAVLALVLALGRYGGLYPMLAQVPGLSSLRAPARHIVLMHFALAGLAAIALEDAFALAAGERSVDVRRLWPLAIPVVLGVAIEIAAAAVSGSHWAGSMDLRLKSVTPALAAVAGAAGIGLYSPRAQCAYAGPRRF